MLIELLDDTTDQPPKFRTRNWVEVNDESRGTCYANSKTEFTTSMVRSSLCDYSDAYIHVNINFKIFSIESK